MKRILIIGGDSFIADHFVRAYSSFFTFFLISRKSTGKDNEIVLNDFFSIPAVVFDGVDVVINFAAIVHRTDIRKDSLYRRINFELPVFLANQAYYSRVKHFIQFSSIAVYGNAHIINSETPYKPDGAYAKYKLLADQKLIEEYKGSHLAITIFRPSMVYGGGSAPGNMVRLIKLANSRFPLPFGRLNNQRQFINIHNLESILNYIILKKYAGIVLAADPIAISTQELIEIIRSQLDIRLSLFHVPGFWAIVKLIKKDLYHKLVGDLIVHNTIPYSYLDKTKIYSVEEGVKEMLNTLLYE